MKIKCSKSRKRNNVNTKSRHLKFTVKASIINSKKVKILKNRFYTQKIMLKVTPMPKNKFIYHKYTVYLKRKNQHLKYAAINTKF